MALAERTREGIGKMEREAKAGVRIFIHDANNPTNPRTNGYVFAQTNALTRIVTGDRSEATIHAERAAATESVRAE